MSSFSLTEIITILPGILLAITCHEFAHGYVAYLFGDPTAKYYGRLTLNPLKHIDPLGFIMLFFAGFGWAKPVPVNPNYFKDRKWGSFLVSIAGIVTNLILALLLTLLLGVYLRVTTTGVLVEAIFYAISINVGLAIFNLLPIPPLDGSKIILSFLSERAEHFYYHYERYAQLLLFVLVYFDVTDIFLNPPRMFIMNHLIGILERII